MSVSTYLQSYQFGTYTQSESENEVRTCDFIAKPMQFYKNLFVKKIY